MAMLRQLVRVELAILAACFGVVFAWKIVRGMLRPEGRLALGRLFGGGVAGLPRMQLLAASLVFALVYLASSLRSAASGALPPIPDYALVLLGSSQAAFLGAAAWRILRPSGFLKNEEEK